MRIAIIGFGEAGHMFGSALAAAHHVRAYDISTVPEIAQRAEEAGVILEDSSDRAIGDAELILSLVTADQSEQAARIAARIIKPGQRYLEMNSVSPDTKRKNASLISESGADLLDVAIMSPVYPAGAAVPLLVAGPDADMVADCLSGIGLNARSAGTEVGRAAAIKMCRSVMIKGIEALTAESLLTARHYGVEKEVLSSLHESFPEMGWNDRAADYLISRIAQHGRRRAAEMREVALTVRESGLQTGMAAEVARTQDHLRDLMDDKGLEYDPAASFDWRSFADRLKGIRQN
ncbi:MAG: NAD(P)-dependent oxidoreductase [Alphaproteobacteria bacterium]|nr:MAG: NAD(P)-dependent oxidoreductase [Alphaproteobacteria bacterium]